MSDYKSVAQHAIECAKKHGAQKASASAYRGQGYGISYRNGKIENIESDGESAISLRLFVDGRYGEFSTSDLRRDSLDTYIKNAIEMTRMLESDPCWDLPDPALYENRADIDLELFDPEITKVTPSHLIDMCAALEAECRKAGDLPILDVSTGYSAGMGETYIIDTNGLEGTRKSNSISGGATIAVKDGDKKVLEHDGTWARYISDLRKPGDVAAKALQKCRYQIGAKKLASKKRTIILDRDETSLLQDFIGPLHGVYFADKDTYFLDKIGQTIASKLLDLRDNPFIKRGMMSRLYDHEGISTKEVTVFDHGKLNHMYLDTYYANKLKMKPTSDDITNLVLTPGKRSLQQMIADVKDGIYVFSLLGGNMDSSTGEFSHGIAGVAIENGKLTQNVSEMNIAGNHLELWKNLTEVGNDPSTEDNILMPALRFDNVSTSGN